MYHRLQRLPLSRTLESPTPELLSTGTDSDASEKTNGSRRRFRCKFGCYVLCAGAGAGAILDPVSHAPIELRKDMGSTAPPL